MTNRREFLKITMASSALSLVHKATAVINTVSHDELLGYYKVIFDKRVSQSRLFARHLNNQGLDTYGMENGDITSFWFNELDSVWRNSPVALMGMTAPGPLFCLETLAKEHGMRIVFKAEHLSSSNNIQHHIQGPEHVIQVSDQHGFASAKNWPADMAELMLSYKAGSKDFSNRYLETVANLDAENIPTEKLISWIIAPAKKLV